MPERYLTDTDVLIDYLRGQPDAIAFLEGLTHPPAMSVITLAKLYAGVRQGDERRHLETFVKAFEVVSIDAEIAEAGGLFRRDYARSHNIGLADALIAATAKVKQRTLVTLNKKHFPMLTDIQVPYHKS